MKRCFKKALSGILASAMLFSSVAFTPVSVSAADFGNVGGWFESIYAEIPGIEDANVKGVSYSGTMNGTLEGEDLQYLVRDYNGGVRIDIPGLKAGNYTLTVNTDQGNITKNNISVMEYDRSGYAHFNYNEGVGAYNNDGTLKENAIVLYVTDDTKDTVTVKSKDGTTVTGIGHILNSAGKDNGSGKNSKGGLPNNNAGIIKKISDDNTPLVVRIVGNVTAPDGVTAYDSADYGGTEGDNGFMARIQNGKNITIEGIGTDATINGWGIHFIASSDDPAAGRGKGFEVRNISFRNVPEDCVGMEGQQEGSTITAGVERCWIHNCAFYGPHISNPAESDKDGGDGACDFKRGQYFTNSYCYYEGYHKTNLVGSSDSSLQYNLTYHHNYWKNCEARGPLARQANIHMYNNVFEGQTDYAMNPRANAYIFSEYNLFYMCKNPMRVDAGAIKSYNDSLSSCIEEMGGTVVTDKNQTVKSGNKYENFDTNSSLSYIPSGDYILQEDITEAKKYVMAYTGVMKEDVVTPDEVSTSLVEPGKQPSASVVLPYKKDLNSTYLTKGTQTKDNIYFSAYKAAGDSISIKEGQAIVFNVNTNANITITDGGGTYPVVLMNDSGVEYLTGSGTVYDVPAGTYFIQPSGFSPAKDGGEPSYKEAKITFLGIEAYDPTAPTVTEPTTQATTEGSDETTTKAQGGDVEDPTEETTSAPYEGEGLVWDYTNGTNTLNANVDANDWSNAEPVSYKGSTFTSAVKMESSSNITFNAPGSGKLTLVTYSGKATPKIKVNGESITVSKNGATTIDIAGGTVTITKDTTDTYLYLMEFVGSGSSEITTEATTVTETTTEATTEAPSETTTEAPAPVEGVQISVGDASVNVGETVTVPVRVSGMDTLANYDIDLTYDDTKLEITAVTNGDMIDVTDDTFVYNTSEAGLIQISAVNTDALKGGEILFNVTFTGVAEGTSDITLTVNELFAENSASVEYTVENGAVTVTDSSTPSTGIKGDVNKDGKADAEDAAIILKIKAGIITNTAAYDMTVADCNEDGNIDELDAVWILRQSQGGSEESTETTTLTTTETTTVSTTEEDTETTTEETVIPEDGVIYNSMTLSRGTNDTYVTVYNDKESDGAWKVDKAKGDIVRGYLMIKLGKTADVTITGGGEKPIMMSQIVGSTDPEFSAAAAETVSFTNVPAGTWYIYNTDGNMTINSIVVTMDGSTPVEPPTEEPTEATTEEATEATTAGTEEPPTESTTESAIDIVGGVVDVKAGDTATLLKAIYTIDAGDTINLEPGTYVFPNSSSGTTAEELQHKIKMFSDNSGTAGAPKTLTCEDGYAVLDFTSHDEIDNYRGIQIDGDYWNVSNMHVKGAGDNGMLITGDYINVDNCIFEGNHDTGLQISRRGSDLTDMADWPHDIKITNCTSFDNMDVKTQENADGFAAKLTCGENIVFDNCIAYNNSDDGWDLYTKKDSGKIGAVTIKNCVAFNNGKLTNGTGGAGGDMNGFKLGGEGIAVSHVVENCIAFNNGACGFTDNNNPGPLTLTNCTSYGNGTISLGKQNFNMYRTENGSVYEDCVSYNTSQTDKITNADMINCILFNKDAKHYVLCNGSYADEGDVKNEPQASISDSDFVSLELPYTDLSKVHEQMRNADGSINMKGFLEIASTSEYTGMGANIN